MLGYIPDEEEYRSEEPRHGQKGVLLMRTRTIRAGEYLEAEIYPVIDQEHAPRERRKKSTEQMRAANIRRARKTLERILNANFGPGDLIAHFTCEEEMTEDEFTAVRRSFMDRLRRAYKRAGQRLKYAYVTEITGSGDRRRYHVHMVLGGGPLSRDEVEGLWRAGLARADRVKMQEHGLAGIAYYITQHKSAQERMMAHKWAASRGLINPEKSRRLCTVSDHKFSRAAAARLDKAVREDAERVFAKRYPGYQLIDWRVSYSDFLPGVYVRAFMRRLN